MTPDRTDAHRLLIERLSADGGPLSKDTPTATVKNPAWFVERQDGRLEIRAGRRALHRQLREEMREESPGVKAERRAIILAGPPGAGKGTTLRQERADVLPSYLVIDADDFKKKLLTEALRDGTYESVIKPQAIKDLEAGGEQFFPLELASLVHEESSMLAASMRDEALRDGTNIVIDTVLSSPEKAADIGRRLERAGYDVEVIDVEVPFALSEERIASRWRGDYLDALEKGEGLGGRWVPAEFAREVFNGPDGKSRPEAAAQSLAESAPNVVRFSRYRTEHEGAPRVLEVDKARVKPGGPLVDRQATLLSSAVQASRATKGRNAPGAALSAVRRPPLSGGKRPPERGPER